jgi:hypothetical protein
MELEGSNRGVIEVLPGIFTDEEGKLRGSLFRMVGVRTAIGN